VVTNPECQSQLQQDSAFFSDPELEISQKFVKNWIQVLLFSAVAGFYVVFINVIF